ncbi:LytTR family transcriptional regulator DNA-binding domain-containing protein [Paenibacillus tritici]|uniref:LytTR family transcriptional regulator DNA-binding domain-containing protein n=1 Tax=Paenibacillus tritici TaxID=1873425 RepID=A0ABX2DK00_9BACL|nr:LytTR family DNA-binding domain-containing protein [Paenibacillus tritici]NQX44955.1 LytTR family transcriptional regulator DNA-binding domain-containing protein [Paenibacillus tritici]
MRILLNDGSSLSIREEDILYFSNHKNTIFVHTKEGEFVLPTTLSDLYAAYGGIGFERLDRSNVVNIGNIDGYDSERKIVLFNQGEQFATVSESNESRIKKYLSTRQTDV